MRKGSLDNENRSVGRSSNGGRTGSNDRVLKLKINKKGGGAALKQSSQSGNQQANPDAQKKNKIIATIQRIRQGGSQTST
jgi:hypothetical protein